MNKVLLVSILLLIFVGSVHAGLTDDLVAYYNFDETSGNLLDQVGSNNGSNSNVTQNQTGKIGKAYSYNGTNSKTDLTATSLPTGNTNISFSAWVKPIVATGWDKFISYGNGATNQQFSLTATTYNNTKNFVFGMWGLGTPPTEPWSANDTWYHVVGVYNGSTMKLYINGTEEASISYSSANITATNFGIGYDRASNDLYFNGLIDEFGFWNKALTSDEITELYNSGFGLTYPFDFNDVFADFDYVVTGTQVDFNDTSSVSGDAVIDSWEWLIDDVSSSNDQNYSFTGTEATDYNVCLIIQDTTLSLEDSTCQTISISDLTPPTTTFSYEQISGTTDTNITLICTDNNSGCKTINFRINNGDWNYYTIGNNPLNIIYNGAGDHNIQFYSTDNADNNETIKTATFSTFGLAKFAFYDEDTKALLNDVVWSVDKPINGVSGGTLTDSNVLDLNLQGITSQEYTFTFTKTGYGPRTYVRTLNQYSDIDLNFALLSTTLSDDIPFKIYQTDETTIYTNTIVELYRPDNNFVIGRKKTNITGNVTFSIHVSDQNYYVRVDDGAFTYQPVALTIYYPKNEETLLQIEEKWKIEITQNLYETYSDLNADKIIYLLPNTSLPFNIRISDMNGTFFTRTYAQQFFGDPRTAELQPYLVSTTTGLLNTITTKDATTNTNIGGVTIKIYKFISGEGRTLVEQVITDAKGQAITLLIAGAEYSFECYYGGVLIKTFEITSTSTTIFIMLDLGSIIEVPDPSGYQATFTPKGTGLINQGVGTVAFTQTMYNYGGKTVSLTSRILQGGVVISQQTANTSLTSYTFTHTINWVDINQTTITSRIIINDGTTNYTFNQDYTITTFFDTNYSILDGLQNGLRRDMTCDANGICFPLLALAIFISIALVIGATIGIGQFGVQSVAIIFLSSMMLFTYLNWVPYILTIVLAVLTFAFIVSERSV